MRIAPSAASQSALAAKNAAQPGQVGEQVAHRTEGLARAHRVGRLLLERGSRGAGGPRRRPRSSPPGRPPPRRTAPGRRSPAAARRPRARARFPPRAPPPGRSATARRRAAAPGPDRGRGRARRRRSRPRTARSRSPAPGPGASWKPSSTSASASTGTPASTNGSRPPIGRAQPVRARAHHHRQEEGHHAPPRRSAPRWPWPSRLRRRRARVGTCRPSSPPARSRTSARRGGRGRPRRCVMRCGAREALLSPARTAPSGGWHPSSRRRILHDHGAVAPERTVVNRHSTGGSRPARRTETCERAGTVLNVRPCDEFAP